MFQMLFDNTWFYVALGVVALVAIIWICVKYPQGRVYMFTLVGIGLVAITCYSGIQLNYYYTARGGIFGALSGIFDTNAVEVENLSISLNNIEMIKEHDDVYSAKVLTPEVLKLDNNVNFMVYVNGDPCTSVITSADYVVAEFDYEFLGEDFKELCRDTLTIRFSLYTDSTYMSVSTQGGATAVKYWNYYFNKNTFVIDIAPADYYSNSISFGKGEVSKNYALANFYVKDKKWLTQVYKTGTQVDFPFPEQIERSFLGWSTDKVNVKEEMAIKENTNFYAVEGEEQIFTVKYMVDSQLFASYRLARNSKLTLPDNATKKGYTFKYWVYNNSRLSDEMRVKNDMIITAEFEPEYQTIEITQTAYGLKFVPSISNEDVIFVEGAYPYQFKVKSGVNFSISVSVIDISSPGAVGGGAYLSDARIVEQDSDSTNKIQFEISSDEQTGILTLSDINASMKIEIFCLVD